jgi:hypothetical protein
LAERQIRIAIRECQKWHGFKECSPYCIEFYTCQLRPDIFEFRPLDTWHKKQEQKQDRRINFNINISTNGSCTLFTDDVNDVMPLFLAITKTIGNPVGIEYSGAFVECLKIDSEGVKLWKEKISNYIFVDPRTDEPFFLIKESKLVPNVDREIARNNRYVWSLKEVV